MNEIIKLAIIGFGNIAKIQIDAINKSNGFYKLIAVAEKNKEKRETVPDGINFYNDYNFMLQNEDIDVVFISIPNDEHYSVCKDVLKKNLSILLEKPATKNKEQLDKLINLYNNNDIRSFYLSLHASKSKEINWFVDKYNSGYFKNYGKIIGFKSTFYDPYIKNDQLIDNAKSLGGSWQDSGINALSVINKILDNKLNIEEVQFTKLKKFKNFEIQGTAYFDFELDNMLGKGVIDTNWTLNKNQKNTKIYFNNTKNKIIIDHTKQSVFLAKYNDKKEVLVDLSNTGKRLVNHYIGILKDFYTHFINKSDNLLFAKKVYNQYFNVLDYVSKGED